MSRAHIIILWQLDHNDDDGVSENSTLPKARDGN